MASALDLEHETSMKVPVTKHIRTETRPFSRSGTFMVWGVAFWVIVWGLRYRLSRYDPLQAPSHQIPSAKPLESDQQANASDSPSASRAKASARAMRTAHTTIFLSFLLAVSLLTSPVSGLKEQKVSRSWHFCRDPFFRTLFVRPPPFLV
jgi:hypothetical protein